jgi:hypothetical protein
MTARRSVVTVTRGNGRTAGKVQIPEGDLPVPRRHELRAVEKLRTDQIGAIEIRAGEDGSEEISAFEVGARQDGTAEICTPQICVAKIGAGEVRVDEVQSV